MSIENQQNLGVSELLDDIQFVNQSTEKEIERVGDDIRQRIDEAKLPQNLSNSIIDEVSEQLGQLAMKVNLTQKAVYSLQATRKISTAAESEFVVERKKDQSGVSFPANIISENNNMLPVEKSPDGISYCWSGSDPEILFNFSLNRQHKLEMQIHLSALIKPEYSKKLKVFIDGQHIKHRFYLDDPLFVISCVLPVSTNTKQTEVRLLLPGTHSPTELGSGADNRILGLAISEVRFGSPGGRLSYLIKRLGLKK
jgi:hypothetical protein